MHLTFFGIAAFIISHLFISLANPGIPGGARFSSFPFFVAAGIPAEGYILAKSVDVFPDMIMTVLNTTGPMAITSIVAKRIPTASSD